MKSTMHPVDFRYSREELEVLFAYAHAHDVDKGGRYDARSAAINVWSHHWAHPATKEDSDTLGTFYVHWAPTPTLYAIECDEGFSLDDLLVELGRLEEQAWGKIIHAACIRWEGSRPWAL
jgi:hypothetical protein